MQLNQVAPVEEGFFLGPCRIGPKGVIATWPRHEDRWPLPLPQIEQALAALLHQMHKHVPVTVLVGAEQGAAARLACGPDINLLTTAFQGDVIGTDGPWHLTDGAGTLKPLHWTNAIHGVRHAPPQRDGYIAPVNLDGHLVMADGRGLIIASEEGLLDADRNPELTMQQVEERLALYLGARHVVWLGGGLHRLRGGLTGALLIGKGPDILVAHVPDDDVNRARLDDMAATLAHDRNADKDPLNVVWIECKTGAGPNGPLDCLVGDGAVFSAAPDQQVADYFGVPHVTLTVDPVLAETGGLSAWLRPLP